MNETGLFKQNKTNNLTVRLNKVKRTMQLFLDALKL